MVRQSIIPAIIPASYIHLEERLRELCGAVRSVQVDVLDGIYTHNTSWPYAGHERAMFDAARREDNGLPYWRELDIEIDLMVAEPGRHIEQWALMGATRLIIHVESTERLTETVAQCNDRRIEVALALRPSTDIALLAPFIEDVVFVQCMGSNQIGSHGVALDPTVVNRIRDIKTRWPDLLVGVDIGVTADTIPTLYAAGARRFAAGSAVFGSGEPLNALKQLNAVVTQCAEHS